MSRYTAVALGVLLAVAVGCRKKPPAEPDPAPAENPKPGAAPANSAVEALRGRGARVTDAFGKPDGLPVNAVLTGPKFGDADVAVLKSFPTLRSVALSRTKVTDAGLAPLAELPDLTMLFLTDTAITDAGLVHVRKLANLNYLYLDGTGVTDAGLEPLKNLTKLVHIDARRTRVTDAGVAKLRAANARIGVAQDTKYVEFTAPDGHFKVSFPWKQPTQTTRNQMTPFGRVADTMFEVKDGSSSAGVAVADFATQLPNVNVEQVVNTGVEALARELPAAVKSDTRSVNGAVVTRDVVFDVRGGNGQGPAYFRYVIHGRRLYTLAVLSDGLSVPEDIKTRFFDSFKLLK